MTTALNLNYLTTEVDGKQVMVVLTPGSEYAFVWQGGCYIDIYIRTQLHADNHGIVIDGNRFFIGDECINVWDYSKKAPEIEWLDAEEYVYVINEWLGYR